MDNLKPAKQPPERATIATIARMVGVNKSTVSRALSNKTKDGKPLVSPQLRQEISAACSKLNFRPNILAQAFVTQRSKTIAAVGRTNSSYFHSRLMVAQEEALQHGYNLNINAINIDTHQDQALEDMFIRWKYDGVWAVGSESDYQQTIIEHCQRHNVPLVFTGQALGCEGAPNVKCIGGDIQRAFEDLINYMYYLGHRRFVWFIPNLETDELAQNYYEYIKHGLSIKQIPKEDITFINIAIDLVKTLKTTEKYIKELQATTPRGEWPTAAISIWSTIGALHGIQRAGLSVPDDLSFITLDYEIEKYGEALNPPVAALHEPARSSGEGAIKLLVDMIDEIEKSSDDIPFEHISLPMVFQENESCKPVREMRGIVSK
jgi:LacI family transcriptional regulator, galactose operon repressor